MLSETSPLGAPGMLAGFARLRAPFPPEQIGKLPRRNRDGGTTYLDYVGHARTTDRLLEVDPNWSWEPLAADERGLPLIVEDSRGQLALWIRITILGQSRLGVGTCGPSANDPLKELIGDAIRNAAMRFGVALDLWMRDEEHGAKPTPAKAAPAKPRRGQAEPEMPEVVRRILASAQELFGDDTAARDEWFRRRLGSYGVARLRECTAEQLAETADDLAGLVAQTKSEP